MGILSPYQCKATTHTILERESSHHRCFTSVSPIFHQSFTRPVFFQCFASVFKSVSPVLLKCTKNVSKVLQSCLFVLKSSQLPECKEGLFELKNILEISFYLTTISFSAFTSLRVIKLMKWLHLRC